MSTDKDFVWCPSCACERDVATLEHDRCPICDGEVRAVIDTSRVEPPPAPKSSKSPKKAAPTPSTPPPPDLFPATARVEASTTGGDAAYEPPRFDMSKALADPEGELIVREACRRDLMTFIRRFRPAYRAGWVHKDICRRLNRFVQQVEEGKSPRLLLMMPPRSGKSEISSRHFPAWALGKHPEWEIIAASHTLSLSLSFSRYGRDLLNDPAYQVIFENSRLDSSSKAIENWNLTAGGGYLAAGVGSGITGRGAHILILDDLVKDMEAADSVVQRDACWEWYGSTAYTRIAPGGGVLGLMTWWHDDDWAGRIQMSMKNDEEADKFEVVRYPAINDYGDEYILPDDSIQQFAPGEEPPPGSQLTRYMNTAIHPDRYTTEMMLRIKRNLYATGQKRVWSALYQQNPAPDEGAYFTKEMFRVSHYPPQRHQCYMFQAWDFAITEGTQNDYTVCVTGALDQNNTLYIVDVVRFRSGDAFVLADSIIDNWSQWGVDMLGVEDSQIWRSIESVFKKRCEERGIFPSYEVMKPYTDKMVRAQPLRGRMQMGKVYFNDLHPYYEELRTELLRFPAGKHDDQVDALAWLVRLVMTKNAPKLPEPKPMKSWKDDLTARLRKDGGVSHMSA